jgi:arylsulfatase A
MRKYIFLIGCLVCMTVNLSAQKTNIILIVADDLGYGDVGCYGQQKIKTPNIDRLARQGVRFTQFYAGTTVCAPSRASLMSGLHTGHTSVRGNVGTKPEGQFPLPDSVTTFASRLQQQGYQTAAFGKWGLGYITTSGDPNKKGFDEFYGYNCQSLAHNYFPDHLWYNHERIDLSGNLNSDSVYSADLIHGKALSFLNGPHTKPFFLFLPYTLPHADVVVPHDSVYEYYRNQFNEKPVTIKGTDNERHHVDAFPHAAFAAMVSRLDRFVGEIMQAVEAKGLSKNTLIIFTSDNGPHKENGGDPDFFNSSGGWKGIKRDLYEGGIRVPFIAVLPGIIPAGSTQAMPAAMWDLYPTFLQLGGIKNPGNLDGISIFPALSGRKQPAHTFFYWEFHEQGGKQAVRMGDWKGIRLQVNKPNPPFELYNLKTDPGEKNNVASRYPGIVKQLLQLMNKAHQPTAAWPLLAAEIIK